MERVILHCDCNSFYASVETVLRPELAAGPMAVCGNPESRHGIILAKNEAAKAFGVQTAETVWQAKNKCPGLTLVPPHREEYDRFSQLVNGIYERYTDQVEPFGIDESWLDVTGSRALFGDGVEIANTLRRVVREELGLTISVGVSFNKVFAKLGSDYKKPDATTYIGRENFREMLYPLPVSTLLYVGRAAQQTLHGIYVDTIGDLAACDRHLLATKLGKLGEQLHDYANGLDESRVKCYYEERELKSVGNGMTFRRDLTSWEDIRLGVLSLSDTVAARMRRHGLKCHTVQVQIRDTNFHTISRQRALEAPTFLAKELGEAALELIHKNWRTGAPIRMLTITGAGLVPAEDAGEQLTLFGGGENHRRRERREQLENAMDRVRERYGRGSLTLGGALGNDIGIEDLRGKES